MTFIRPYHQRIAAILEVILQDLSKVIALLRDKDGLLEKCIAAMDISVPRALHWQNINKLIQGKPSLS